jgi:hypothetical protein
MRAARIWLLLLVWLFSFGWIQPEHVQQDGGDVGHHDEGNEHDEPRQNSEPAHAQLVEQNGKHDHDNNFQKSAVLLPPK